MTYEEQTHAVVTITLDRTGSRHAATEVEVEARPAPTDIARTFNVWSFV